MLASCRQGVLDPHGPVGQAERVILYNATAIMLAVVVPVIVLTLAFAWWFRAGNRRATYRPDWEYSGTIELIVWAIPALVILFLGGIAWIGSHELDPPKPLVSATSPLEVEVVCRLEPLKTVGYPVPRKADTPGADRRKPPLIAL
jgi:cytochrome o ubiquinol oxidase subunit 2